MKIVFAKVRFVYGPGLVMAGSHWPADDPVVLAVPDNFSDDPRVGLSYSVEPADFRDESSPLRQKRSYVRRNLAAV